MKKLLGMSLLFFLFLTFSKGQYSEFFCGVNFPINYAIGYQHGLNDKFSANLQAGYLTQPFNTIIVDIIEFYNADENVLKVLRDANFRGINLQAGLKYHIKKFYGGISYACLRLTLQDYMSEVLYNYTGYNLELPRNTYLTLNSYLHNGGLFAGRKFSIKESRFSINIEFAVQKNFYSSSTLKSDTGNEINSLSGLIKNNLSQYYLDYGIIPSLNFFVVYSLNKN